jgi:CBS domain-containing protein
MIEILECDITSRMMLSAETAADLMTPNPVSIRDNATVSEAVACLTDKGISAAPVIDKAGRAVGVVSRSDLLIHDRERVESPALSDDSGGETAEPGRHIPKGFHEHVVDRTQVHEIMTPAVFCVTPQTSARQVVEQMLGFKVHRLFVVDSQGILVGTISALDVLRNLE